MTEFYKRFYNYFIFRRHENLYSSKMHMEKLDNCKTCSKHVHIIKVDESENWKHIKEKNIQISHVEANQEYSIFNDIAFIYKTTKEQNGEIKILNIID